MLANPFNRNKENEFRGDMMSLTPSSFLFCCCCLETFHLVIFSGKWKYRCAFSFVVIPNLWSRRLWLWLQRVRMWAKDKTLGNAEFFKESGKRIGTNNGAWSEKSEKQRKSRTVYYHGIKERINEAYVKSIFG